ncbi:hypothetical protein M407DRAFT_174692 [Tulasnella calospora MUT 4182]|uniref:Uncharacterized protein n=1 Tax=Tulasnella calospora MUT 4182 TaxID=1051891 RepID=A0A0C3QME1_9AGAM|nr:hypothetical protein M407DRAFT_174692 [Tulasnella calospora MUT 4182]
MRSCSERVLNVKLEELAEFEAEVKRDYGTGGLKTGAAPCPSHLPPLPLPLPPPRCPRRPSHPSVPALPVPTTRPDISYSPTGTPESSPPSPSHSDSSLPTSSEPRKPPTPDVPSSITAHAVALNSCSGMSAVKGGATSMPMSKPVHPIASCFRSIQIVKENIPGNGQPFAFAGATKWCFSSCILSLFAS